MGIVWLVGLCATATAVGLAWYRNGAFLVALRDALFTDFDAAGSFLLGTPEQLRSRGFRTDSPSVRADWAARIRDVPYLTPLAEIARRADAADRAKAIVRLFSRGGGSGCGSIDELIEKLRRLPEGYGCCSDHAEAFLALAPVVRLEGREMITSRHTVVEFYDPRRGGWVFIDPQLGLISRDTTGAYLSLSEIRRRVLQGEPVNFDFFGHAGQITASGGDKVHEYYGTPDAVRRLRMPLGNNVFEVQRFNQKYHWLPKSVRHLAGHLAGVIPRYLMLVDNHNRQDLRLLRTASSLPRLLPRASGRTHSGD